MDAIILCGGQGIRLRPVVPDLPKCLAPVAGRPFLDYILDDLAKQGVVDRVILALGYKAEMVTAHYAANPPKLPLLYSIEPEPRGTASALFEAVEISRGEDVLIMNGDTFVYFNQREFVEIHKAKGHCFTKLANSGVYAAKTLQMPWDIEKAFIAYISEEVPIFIDIGTPEEYAAAQEIFKCESS